jgi:hypothetical protein
MLRLRRGHELANAPAPQLAQRRAAQVCGKLIDIDYRALPRNQEGFVVSRNVQTFPNGAQQLLFASRSV